MKLIPIIVAAFISLAITSSGSDNAVADFVTEYANDTYENEDFTEFIYVGIKRQKLYHIKDNNLVNVYNVSTSKKGAGNKFGSFQTPTGLHVIEGKHGDKVPIGGVIVNKEFTGEITEIYADRTDTSDDFITTRVLTLSGKERGLNSGSSKVDTYKRQIYIHGTAEEGLIGSPASHGCIRMRNVEVVELFNSIQPGTRVLILDN